MKRKILVAILCIIIWLVGAYLISACTESELLLTNHLVDATYNGMIR